MAAIFLLVGLASDGPSNVPYRPKDLRDLKMWFGGEYRERFYLSSSVTGVTLQYEPTVMPLNEVDGRKQYLFAPTFDTVSRNVIYFGNIGGSGDHIVDFIYQPYVGKADLLTCAKRYIEHTGEMPYVLRIGGNVATVSVSGWYFESKYAGQKYNNLGLSSNGSSLTVFGLEPNYPTKTFNFTSDVEDIKRTINNNFDIGTLPITCITAGVSSIPAGVYWFSGGTDGNFSDADISNLLENYTLPMETNHVLLLSEISSSMIQSIETSMSERQQPRMFFVPGLTYFGSGSAQWYIDNLAYYVPNRHNMVACIVGDVTLTYQSRRIRRYSAEAAALAYAKKLGYNVTHLKVDAESFSPVLSEENLNLLKAAGLMTITRHIESDISVYEGTTTYNENSFLYSSKVAEISSIAYSYCHQFLGLSIPDGKRSDMSQQLYSLLSSINYIQLRSVEVEKLGEELFVNIEATLPSEILSISFTIQNK
jgi:hypothetical protein